MIFDKKFKLFIFEKGEKNEHNIFKKVNIKTINEIKIMLVYFKKGDFDKMDRFIAGQIFEYLGSVKDV